MQLVQLLHILQFLNHKGYVQVGLFLFFFLFWTVFNYV